MKARLCRSPDGRIAHLQDCARKGKKTLPWEWAHKQPAWLVLGFVRDNNHGIRWCRHCDPYKVLSREAYGY